MYFSCTEVKARVEYHSGTGESILVHVTKDRPQRKLQTDFMRKIKAPGVQTSHESCWAITCPLCGNSAVCKFW